MKVASHSRPGVFYYFNKATKESKWKLPQTSKTKVNGLLYNFALIHIISPHPLQVSKRDENVKVKVTQSAAIPRSSQSLPHTRVTTSHAGPGSKVRDIACSMITTLLIAWYTHIITASSSPILHIFTLHLSLHCYLFPCLCTCMVKTDVRLAANFVHINIVLILHTGVCIFTIPHQTVSVMHGENCSFSAYNYELHLFALRG